jgi:hypothetical protein
MSRVAHNRASLYLTMFAGVYSEREIS